MRIATWNVNSLKVRLEQVGRWLTEQAQAGAPIDYLCLQELKLDDPLFPHAGLAEFGYTAIHAGQKTYNGVAIVARAGAPEPTDVQRNIPGFDDPQQRVLAATYACADGVPLRLISAYFPNGQAPDSPKFAYKLDWLAALTRWLEQELARYPRLALLGDFNIAPVDADVCDPAKWAGQNLVSPPERAAFVALEQLGLTDAFRLFAQPERSFSWWDYRMAAFRRNAGLRIDHVLLSQPLVPLCTASTIDPTPRGWEQPSDHAPVVATLALGG